MAVAPRAFLDNVVERRKYICSGGARVDSPNFCEIGLIGDLGDKKGIILSLFSFPFWGYATVHYGWGYSYGDSTSEGVLGWWSGIGMAPQAKIFGW